MAKDAWSPETTPYVGRSHDLQQTIDDLEAIGMQHDLRSYGNKIHALAVVKPGPHPQCRT